MRETTTEEEVARHKTGLRPEPERSRSKLSDPARGSAAVEFVVLVPFVLVLTAAVWDLRVFAAYRTDVAREMYVIAQLVAGGAEWPSGTSVDHVIDAAAARLGEASAGVLHVAVVTRGTSRHDGSACADDNAWCAPVVGRAFYDRAFPSGEGDCAHVARALPDAGQPFASTATVLANEDADPDGAGSLSAPPVNEWVSRNIRPQEWWVVVDSCSHFGGGPRSRLIGGRFVQMGLATLDVSPVMVRREVWSSIDDLDECGWCAAPAGPPGVT